MLYNQIGRILAFLLLFSTTICGLQGQSNPQVSPSSWSSEEILYHMVHKDTTYHAIAYQANAYIDNNPQDLSLAKKFARWDYFWASRVTSSGDFSMANQVMNTVANSPVCLGGGNWSILGPRLYDKLAMGIIVSIYSPPGQADTIFAGSNSGGLWKSTDGGLSWLCKTDHLRIPAMGVNSIAGDPNNSNVLYIATGNSTTAFGETYGQGVLKSVDGGETWTPTSLSWNPPLSEVTVKIVVDGSHTLNTPNGIESKTIYAITTHNIYLSEDAGVSFNGLKQDIRNQDSTWNYQEFTHGSFWDIEIGIQDPTKIIITTNPGATNNGKHARVYLMDNPGTGISNISIQDVTPSSFIPPIDSAVSFYAATTEIEDQRFYIFTSTKADPAEGSIFWMDNYSGIWDTKSFSISSGFSSTQTFVPGPFLGVFEINQKNLGIFYIGNHVLARTTDACSTFTRISIYEPGITHADIRALQILGSSGDGKNDTIIMGNDGGVNKHLKGGFPTSDWQKLNGNGIDIDQDGSPDDLVITQVFDINNSSFEPIKFIGTGNQDNGYIHNGQISWDHTNVGDGGQVVRKGNNIFLKENSGVGRRNLANTQASILTFMVGNQFKDYIFRLAPSNPEILYWTKKGNVNQSVFLGKISNISGNDTASKSQISGFGRPDPQSMAVADSAGTAIIYIGLGNQRLIKSNNDGQIWHSICDPTDLQNPCQEFEDMFINDIVVDPENHLRMWIGLKGFDSAYRVVFSGDGGATWHNDSMISQIGLPPLPINVLRYHKGSNDILYAGTDVGVFRYNPLIQEWECWNNGLPVSVVSDIEIDYCRNLIQIATFGRGVWETGLPPIDPTEIASDQTLGTGESQNFSEDIIVKSGARWTVRGTVNMAQHKKIIVESGGELLLDGGIITSPCDGFWQGIVLAGDSTTYQQGLFPTNTQGKVRTTNGAIIEHAITGISTILNKKTGSGGIIDASATTFQNNICDIEYGEFKNINPSSNLEASNMGSFSNCTFKITDEFRGTYISPRINFNGVRGIELTACGFINLNSSPQINAEPDLCGIRSFDSNFFLRGACQTSASGGSGCVTYVPLSSTFENFRVGVDARKIVGNPTFTIDGIVFKNNVVGVAVSAVDQAHILRSTFETGRPAYIATSTRTGVLLTSSTAYWVEGNTFTGSNNDTEIGVYVNNSGPEENEIFRNTYTNLAVANFAVGDNRQNTNSRTDPGLQFLCSNESQNIRDILVGGGEGIRFYQGRPDNVGTGTNAESDGNIFSQPSQLIIHNNYENLSTNDLSRFFYSSNTQELAGSVNSNKITQINGNENTCVPDPLLIPQILLPNSQITAINQFNIQLNQYSNSIYLLETIIDGGNTQALQNQVQFTWSNDAWEMRDQLMAQSPNLSQEILAEAAYTGTLPDALLMEVLLANADVCQDEEFLSMLENDIPNPLPSYMIDILSQAQEPASYKQDIQKQVVYHHEQLSNISNEIMSSILNKDELNSDSLRTWLAKGYTHISKYRIAESYLQDKLYTQASSTITGLDQQYDYLDESGSDYDDYETLFSLKANILENQASLANTTLSQRNQINTLALEEDGPSSIIAKNWLCYLDGNCDDIEVPNVPNSTPARKRSSSGNVNNILTYVEVRPNPAKDYVEFVYQLPEEVEGAQITIYDIHGRMVHAIPLSQVRSQKLWDTREVPSGVYVYKVMNQLTSLTQGKLVIQH
ncbi:MAG: T9SS type A sorting domain-containing protein [Bacteroidota bacterium]